MTSLLTYVNFPNSPNPYHYLGIFNVTLRGKTDPQFAGLFCCLVEQTASTVVSQLRTRGTIKGNETENKTVYQPATIKTTTMNASKISAYNRVI